jgi:S1-C subfamily serine protease
MRMNRRARFAPLRRTFRRSLAALGFLVFFSAVSARVSAEVAPASPPVPAPAPVPSPPVPAAPLSTAAPVSAAPAGSGADANTQWLKAVYEHVSDAVVLIETESGAGSGFFFHTPRHVATALHVVDDAELIVVRTSDGRRALGNVVAYSRTHDIALLELEGDVPDAKVLTPHLGGVEIGERVAVIGHPFSGLDRSLPELKGLLNWSLTQGVVSAVAGSWLQTDASINPGNSGGPVLNREGEVIGVVSAKLDGAQGIGLIVRAARLQDLVARIGTQPPPRRAVAFDGVELGFVVHWQDESIDGFSVGAGLLLRKRYPLMLRLGFMGGEVEPDSPTILSTRLERFSAELTGGVAFPLGEWLEISPYVGGALFYDRKHDASLRIDGSVACPTPPCLVQGRVIRSLEKQVRLLPLIGASLDLARLRLSYAYQFYLADLSESQHRVIAGIVF